MLLLIGLAVQYWYISLALVAVLAVVALIARSKKREQAARRSGPRDPWLNEVAVALAELGLTESARNTGAQLGGVPIEGDIGLQADKFKVYVTRFATSPAARQAELGLRATQNIRDAVSNGFSAIRTVDEVVYVANGRGGVVDDLRLEEVVRVVGSLGIPEPLVAPSVATSPQTPGPAAAGAPVIGPDVIEQLRKLGELRAAGVLTEVEFEAKKADLLRRI